MHDNASHYLFQNDVIALNCNDNKFTRPEMQRHEVEKVDERFNINWLKAHKKQTNDKDGMVQHIYAYQNHIMDFLQDFIAKRLEQFIQ
jgi:hypothetical protein